MEVADLDVLGDSTRAVKSWALKHKSMYQHPCNMYTYIYTHTYICILRKFTYTCLQTYIHISLPHDLRAKTSVSALLLYNITIYYTLLYSTLPYSTLLYSTLLYSTLLYSTLLYSTLLYYTILYYTILYYTILYYTILYYTILILY